MSLKSKILNFRFNRWGILAVSLLLIIAIQSCRPGECLESMVAVGIGFIIVSLVILVLSFLIPFIGPILGVLLIGYLFVDGCLGGEGGLYNNVNKSCGCSAFCNTVKPETTNQELTELHPFKGGEDELEKEN